MFYLSNIRAMQLEPKKCDCLCLSSARISFSFCPKSSVSGEGNGNPLQYSCLENPIDKGLVSCSSQGSKESDTTEAA